MSSVRSRSGGTSIGKYVEPIKEILAKASTGHGGYQISIGRSDDSHINSDRLCSSDSLKFSLLQDPQESDLGIRRKFTHLIQKDRAPIGLFKTAEPPLCSSCKGPFLVTEQLRRDQRRCQCGAVHADEGTSGPLRLFVHGAGDELLTGASFPRDEHRGIGRRHFGNPREDRLQRLGGTDDFLKHLSAVDLVSQRKILPIKLILERPDFRFSLFLFAQIEGEGDAVMAAGPGTG